MQRQYRCGDAVAGAGEHQQQPVEQKSDVAEATGRLKKEQIQSLRRTAPN
jgi:hypothetical protein